MSTDSESDHNPEEEEEEDDEDSPRSRSRSGSRSGSHHSGSGSHSRSGSHSGSHSGSRSGSGSHKSGSGSGSRGSRSKSRSPSPHSGSRHSGSHSGSGSHKSGSGSHHSGSHHSGSHHSGSHHSESHHSDKSASGSGSKHSRSESGSRSHSGSEKSASKHSGSGSEKSASRSRSASPKRSESHSPAHSDAESKHSSSPRSRSPSKSPSRTPSKHSETGSEKSHSPSRSHSPSPSRSHSKESSKSSHHSSHHSSPSGSEGKRSGGSASSHSGDDRDESHSGDDSETSGEKTGSESEHTASEEGDESDSASFDSEYASEVDSEDENQDGYTPEKEWFISLPEPEIPGLSDRANALIPHIDEKEYSYLKGLQQNISALQSYLRKLHTEEFEVMNKFVVKLHHHDEEAKKGKTNEKDLEKLRQDFEDKITRIRTSRREYRALMFDAIQERKNYIDSKEQQYDEALRAKKHYEHIYPPEGIDWFLIFFFLIQLLIAVSYLLWMVYPSQYHVENTRGVFPGAIEYFYTYIIDMLMLTFLGFGLLAAVPRNNRWSGLGFNLLLGAYAIQASYLLLGFLKMATRKIDDHYWEPTQLDIFDVGPSIYCAAAVMISLSAVIGNISPPGLLIMATIEIIAWIMNYWIIIDRYSVVDNGGSMTVHTFGALFGVTFSILVSKFYDSELERIHKKKEDEKKAKGEKVEEQAPIDKTSENQASYQSDALGLGGTIIVCAFIPSFNAFFAYPSLQASAVINTIIGVVGSVLIAFSVSYIFNGQRFSMIQLQTAALAGGVMLASAHNMFIPPYAASIIGCSAGLFVLIFHWLFTQPVFVATLGLRDHRHSLARHGVPGILGAVCSMIVLAAPAIKGDKIYGVEYNVVFHDHQSDQSTWQLWGLLTTIAISVGSAIIAGVIIKLLVSQIKPPKRPFVEHKYWIPLGTDYDGASL